MSAPQGMSVSEQIRCGTGPMYQHMRGIIVEKGRVIEGVRGLLIVHLSYGAESCPIGFYELTFTDRASVRQWWHFEQQKPLLPARARALVDMDRLLPHERQLFEEQQTTPSVADYLREFQDVAVVQHMRSAIAAQGHAIDDVTEVLFRELIYEGEPKGDWKTYERSHIGFYDLTFADRATIHQYWHFERNAPLTYAQAKAELDIKRLKPMDLTFFQEDKASDRG